MGQVHEISALISYAPKPHLNANVDVASGARGLIVCLSFPLSPLPPYFVYEIHRFRRISAYAQAFLSIPLV